jgi:hypothetical protein
VATDVVFFLKSMATSAVRALPWPRPTVFVNLDPGPLSCGGEDRLCSAAYTRLWQSLRDSRGQVMPTLLGRYARGVSVGRVAFVGFSAAHGFLNPLADNPADRAMIDAYVLMDATFGGGKTGYASIALDAVRGRRLVVTTTSNTGGDDGWQLVWQRVLAAAHQQPKRVEARSPMPEPSGGAYRLGSSLYWLRYVNAQGGTELPHWEMGSVLAPMIAAYLIPYWQGGLGFPIGHLLAGAALAGGAYYAYSRITS